MSTTFLPGRFWFCDLRQWISTMPNPVQFIYCKYLPQACMKTAMCFWVPSWISKSTMGCYLQFGFALYPYPIVIHANPPTSSTLHKLPFPSPIDSKGFFTNLASLHMQKCTCLGFIFFKSLNSFCEKNKH